MSIISIADISLNSHSVPTKLILDLYQQHVHTVYTVEPLNVGHVVGGSTVQQPVVHAPASIMFISYKMKVFLNISIHSI